jgi:adenosylcobinamide-GDP ribazoletransferase
LVVTADLGLTGLLHVDGLADSADGLLPHLEPEQRLAVMQSPGVGAFAVAVTAVTVLLRLVALASIAASPLLLAGLWCASRSLMVLLAARLPYARPEGGLATAFLGGSPQAAAVCGLLTGAILAGLWSPLAGLVSVVGAGAVAWAVAILARRRIGGFTGDVLGAAGLLAETAGLVLAAAKW